MRGHGAEGELLLSDCICIWLGAAAQSSSQTEGLALEKNYELWLSSAREVAPTERPVLMVPDTSKRSPRTSAQSQLVVCTRDLCLPEQRSRDICLVVSQGIAHFTGKPVAILDYLDRKPVVNEGRVVRDCHRPEHGHVPIER